MDARLVRLSKRLSLVLRHRPESAGLTLDPAGWIEVDALLAALGISRAELDAVVAGNDKRRFAVVPGPDGRDRIRASQGHSARVEIDLGLAPVAPPESLYHGTPSANVPSIRASGLVPRTRHHVHLSPDRATAQRVGRRRSGDVTILVVAAGRMAADGYTFYRSDNGVWLTEAVPPEYVGRG